MVNPRLVYWSLNLLALKRKNKTELPVFGRLIKNLGLLVFYDATAVYPELHHQGMSVKQMQIADFFIQISTSQN